MSGECDACGHHVLECLCKESSVEHGRCEGLMIKSRLSMALQREDVEALASCFENVTEDDAYQSPWTWGQSCKTVASVLRALVEDRDAAFAAGQEEMRERAAVAVRPDGYRTLYEDDALLERAKQTIRALPIKDRPTSA